jgi:hypothetical protein
MEKALSLNNIITNLVSITRISLGKFEFMVAMLHSSHRLAWKKRHVYRRY